MGNMTLAIPDDLLKRMKELKEIRWSEVARQAIEKRVNDLEIVERIASKSKLTKKDIEEFSKKINSAATKRFLNEHNN
jgi:predicted CopG family antitoxin